ncbi:glycosyltransferase family 2 protein [Lichenicola sp.]|uniref:glycosyltransferase family 2 protein n=1 Tax=Lichenicola sp. TaxID=2804529 RepID=UPI003B00ECA7
MDERSGGQGGRTVETAADVTPVAVLLSTYNGARYLPQQIESLLQQSFRSWSLLWRDDGSSDETATLMQAFAEQAGPCRCPPIQDQDGHVGIAGSFLSLLRRVPPDTIAAFADQDDIWLPDKLRRGVDALAAVPKDVPALYCARQRLVDENLAPLGLSPYRGRPGRFPAALTQNVATGCTVMLNPAGVALVAASQAPAGTLHDWWSYLVVSAAGGQLIADPVPVVLYRQHQQNAVGAPHSPLRRGVMALRRGPDEFMQLFRRHVDGLMAYRHALSPAALRDLEALHRALSGGLLSRLQAMRQVRSLIRQTPAETLLFRLWFLIG